MQRSRVALNVGLALTTRTVLTTLLLLLMADGFRFTPVRLLALVGNKLFCLTIHDAICGLCQHSFRMITNGSMAFVCCYSLFLTYNHILTYVNLL